MSDIERPDVPDLSSYVLGELSDEQRREFEQLAAADAELAAEVSELEQLVARMQKVDEEAWSAPEPPPLRLEAVLAQADETQRREQRAGSGGRVPSERGLLGRLLGGTWNVRPVLAAAGAVVVFVGGLGAGALLAGDDVASPGGEQLAGRNVALQPIGDLEPNAKGDAVLEDSNRRIRIRVNGLEPNSTGDFYEAWLMDPEKGLVSIGGFKVGDDGKAEIDVPVPVNPDTFPVIDISLEPADGAPAHSGKSVLRADLS